LGERIQAIPTIGFNVEELTYRNLQLTVWDVGGQSKIRALWKHYYAGTDALIYVVDSTDTDRLNEAGSELQHLMRDDALGDVPVLVFANKQDLPNAATIQMVGDRLGLSSGEKTNNNSGRLFRWYVQSCSATRNEGLYEGLDWLAREVVVASAERRNAKT
jgi:small GTP-binding protein